MCELKQLNVNLVERVVVLEKYRYIIKNKCNYYRIVKILE